MSREQRSLVIVIRAWHDDGGIRAVLQASTTPAERAFISAAALQRAISEILEGWQRDSGGEARVRRLRGE